jgi:SSS family solute:Na+ symporter
LQIYPDFADWLIIAAYFFYLLYVIFRSFLAPAPNDDNNYILAGRKLTLPAFVATLVSTWYGGILGVGEFTWLYGLSNWVVFGLPYYIFALIFALFFAKRIRKSNLLTLPDQFELHYGKYAASFSGFLLFIVTLPAPYLLMLGFLISLLSGLSLFTATIVGAVFSLVYIFTGGFKSVVQTDKIQFVLMFGGFFVTFFILNFSEYPFWRLPAYLPESHLTLTGGNSAAYILVWYIIAAQTLIDPNFYQRTYAAETPAAAKKGILISILFWAVFDFLTTTVGLYARAVMPELQDPALSFPLLGARYLPPVIKGLFFTGMLATIMSSVDSFSFVSAISLGRDTINRLKGVKEDRSKKAIEWSLLLASAVSIFLIYYQRSIIGLWYQLGSVAVPSLLLPLLLARFFPGNYNRGLILGGMAASSLATLLAIIFPSFLALWQQPVYTGILVQISFIAFIFLTSKKINA